MGKEIRFSEVLRRFRRSVDALPKAERDKVMEAIRGAIVRDPDKRMVPLSGGRTAFVRKVNFDAIESAVPERLKAAAADLKEKATDENGKRGRLWAATCMAFAIEEHILGVPPTYPTAADVDTDDLGV